MSKIEYSRIKTSAELEKALVQAKKRSEFCAQALDESVTSLKKSLSPMKIVSNGLGVILKFSRRLSLALLALSKLCKATSSKK